MNHKDVDVSQKISEYQEKMLDWLFNNSQARERDKDQRDWDHAQGGF